MNIGFIGTGNMATNLAASFLGAGLSVKAMYSRNTLLHMDFSNEYGVEITDDLSKFEMLCDVIFITTPDSEIEKYSQLIKTNSEQTILHCSGSTVLSVIKHINSGVFYPLQTLTSQKLTNFKEVPIIVEASNSSTLEKINTIATKISNNVTTMDSEQRAKLHLAAVVTNNFVYYLNSLSREWLKQNNISDQLLKPLAIKTIENSFDGEPFTLQTGPAIRHDLNTIERHLAMLENNQEIQEIYKILSEEILKRNRIN